ncbi:MAG TPA: FumA C-terminus/TtdB family hydratase beta subunit [Dehalococcoidia bacterium]|nr:FumA C-terminus/TtdB family hydratase beta subunit [Dehalococcoidia bacterium]
MAEHRITLPLTGDIVAALRAGDYVYITGELLTARDAAHKRMCEALRNGQALPVDIRGQVIYYVGPTPAKPGAIIGSAGPTTSERMDGFTIPLLEAGLKGAIGKGGRSPAVREAFAKHRAVYFLAVGGAGALLSKQVRSVEVVAYEDLGTEAIRRIRVEDFPAIVCNDIYGGDALQQGKAQWRREDVLHPETV